MWPAGEEHGLSAQRDPDASRTRRTVLHVGCGTYAPEKLHPVFRDGSWQEIRMDLDPRTKPDLVGSMTDLSVFGDGTVGAVWSAHNIEHLHDHEVPVAFREFRRVLARNGYALITTPDLAAVAGLVVNGKLEAPAYHSPAGPITALDMLFGHRASIRAGFDLMAHRTAFTAERLVRLLLEAGFPKVLVRRGLRYDLWAVALASETSQDDAFADLIRES
ncbi:class I SAM-dependent methyltransferase [Methylobacterium tarhaniae]|uniref:class I SAM-dependent methyltransferase n=1 Tax=Methylobacterium tarhaniae TaxID=1187852 RepID=UPI003CFFDEFB